MCAVSGCNDIGFRAFVSSNRSASEKQLEAEDYMKLILKDNSIRVRLLRSEVDALAGTGRIEAHTLLSLTDEWERLSYAIEPADRYRTIGVSRIDVKFE
jgi:hypothetical protein